MNSSQMDVVNNLELQRFDHNENKNDGSLDSALFPG